MAPLPVTIPIHPSGFFRGNAKSPAPEVIRTQGVYAMGIRRNRKPSANVVVNTPISVDELDDTFFVKVVELVNPCPGGQGDA